MKIKNLSFLFFGLLISLVNQVKGQTDNTIECLALVKKDSVVLRWVPASIPVWQTGIKFGYVITRYTIAKDGVFIPDGLNTGKLITPVPLRPVSNEIFDEIALSDPRISVVQEAIYGTDFQLPTESQNFGGFIKSYEDLEVRFGFALFMCDLSPVIAKSAGLQFTDHNVKPGERYVYSISLSNIPDGLQIDPAVLVIDADQITSLPRVTDLQAVFLDEKVNLQWPVMLFKGTYTAYIVEKSLNGFDFQPVSDLPLVNVSENDDPDNFVYTDSLAGNFIDTWYRVKGISPFGEEGPPSEIIKGKGMPEFSAYVVIDSTAVMDNDKVFLRWRIPETQSSPVTGINVMWSEKYNGVYKNLTPGGLSPDTRIFTDLRPSLSNYYKIILSGEKGLSSSSFPFLVQTEDILAPAPPSMLAGKVDSAGITTIVWAQNQEPDLMGYKVFRANAPHEDFIALNSDLLTQNLFFDTINLNTLTKTICYKVVAVDNSFNNSDYSSTLELSRPDTIPPARALIKRIDLTEGKVTIRLEASPSNDISYYELLRVAENDDDSVTLNKWISELPAVYEDPCSIGGSYQYLLRTIDSAGNVSIFDRLVFIPSSGQKDVILKAETNINGKTILLSWEVPSGIVPAKTLIYRCKSGNPLSVYKTLAGEEQEYEDNEIEIGMNYSYRIRIFDSLSNAILNSGLTEVAPYSNSTSK